LDHHSCHNSFSCACLTFQVEVNDVHISLESGDCSAGVVMESLTLFTTDARGNRTFVDRTTGDSKLANSFLHKSLQIRGLGIYLDEEENIFHSMNSISEYGTENEQQSQQSHSYILAPLSFEATLRQADGNVCIDYPKYLLSSKLPSLSVILSKSQFELCAQIAQKVNPPGDAIKPLFPEYRPLRRVTKETAAQWWKYAYRCVGRLSGRRGWKEFFLAFIRRKYYIPLYKRDAHHADCHWLEPLSPKEVNQLHSIENDRAVPIDAIMTWRNIADAQYEKEQEKYDATKSAQQKATRRSFFFGTSESAVTQATDHQPPITLSVEEMKELETISMSQLMEEELSNDSKLCSIHFVLGSLRINLNSDLRPVTSFNMGKVAAAFKAHADGSFVSSLRVSSLDITDMVTPKSLYPSVLSSLHKETKAGVYEDIFSIELSKTKEGDQKLSAKLVSFQAVSSPMLLKELKRFFTASYGTRPVNRSVKQNPILAKSISGSVDLFYDANEGTDIQPPSNTANNEGESSAPGTSTFSDALIEAWKAKAETKASWAVDLNIRAPILVLPENCVHRSSDVLVLDLGHLQLQYGKIEAAPEIQKWFSEHPKGKGIDPVVDNGKLGITNMTFMVTETEAWHKVVSQHGSADTPLRSEAVVEPISIAFDFATESVSASEIPRGCAVGVVPSIALRLSPKQAAKILNVYSAWRRLIKESDKSRDETMDDNAASQHDESLSTNEMAVMPSTKPEEGTASEVAEAPFPLFYFAIWLQRLSIVLDFEGDGGVDAHLVSVNASMSSMSDNSSLANLSMGWFWILDRFHRSYARRQRLVAHSNLPLPPHLFAVDEKYAILEELESIGVFRNKSSEAAELANITYRSRNSKPHDCLAPVNQFQAEDPFVGGEESGRVDAKFSSLFIHWNPQAIKTLVFMVGKFKEFLETSSREEDDPLLIVAANSKSTTKPTRTLFSSSKLSQKDVTARGSGGGLFAIHAEMKSFEITLNSARDDLPLFVLTMSRAKIATLSARNGDYFVSLALGDFRLATPETCETLPEYRTLLGLAPAQTESLLCVKYWSGSTAMQGVSLDHSDMDRCEAFADVELSPMRLVYMYVQQKRLVLDSS